MAKQDSSMHRYHLAETVTPVSWSHDRHVITWSRLGCVDAFNEPDILTPYPQTRTKQKPECSFLKGGEVERTNTTRTKNRTTRTKQKSEFCCLHPLRCPLCRIEILSTIGDRKVRENTPSGDIYFSNAQYQVVFCFFFKEKKKIQKTKTKTKQKETRELLAPVCSRFVVFLIFFPFLSPFPLLFSLTLPPSLSLHVSLFLFPTPFFSYLFLSLLSLFLSNFLSPSSPLSLSSLFIPLSPILFSLTSFSLLQAYLALSLIFASFRILSFSVPSVLLSLSLSLLPSLPPLFLPFSLSLYLYLSLSLSLFPLISSLTSFSLRKYLSLIFLSLLSLSFLPLSLSLSQNPFTCAFLGKSTQSKGTGLLLAMISASVKKWTYPFGLPFCLHLETMAWFWRLHLCRIKDAPCML